MNVGERRLAMLAAGWTPIPARGKAGCKDWSRAAVTAEWLGRMAGYPSTAIRCGDGGVVAVDMDIDDERAVDLVAGAVLATLGEPALVRTREGAPRGREAWLYRVGSGGGVRGWSVGKWAQPGAAAPPQVGLDLLGSGRLLLVDGRHPSGSGRYGIETWAGDMLSDGLARVGADRLEVVTEAALAGMRVAVIRALEEGGWERVEEGGGGDMVDVWDLDLDLEFDGRTVRELWQEQWTGRVCMAPLRAGARSEDSGEFRIGGGGEGDWALFDWVARRVHRIPVEDLLELEGVTGTADDRETVEGEGVFLALSDADNRVYRIGADPPLGGATMMATLLGAAGDRKQEAAIKRTIRRFDGFRFNPREGRTFRGEDGGHWLNRYRPPRWERGEWEWARSGEMWNGAGGGLGLWRELLKRVAGEDWALVEEWVARKLWEPWERGHVLLFVAATEGGREVQGTGRGTLARLMDRLLGHKNEVPFDLLARRGNQGVYTEWAAESLLTVVDEGRGSVEDQRFVRAAGAGAYEIVKEFTDPGAKDMLIVRKGVKNTRERVYTSLWICTNDWQSLVVPEDDRRIVVLRAAPLDGVAERGRYFQAVHKAIDTDAWVAGLYWWLRGRGEELAAGAGDGWTKSPAPQTAAKAFLVDINGGYGDEQEEQDWDFRVGLAKLGVEVLGSGEADALFRELVALGAVESDARWAFRAWVKKLPPHPGRAVRVEVGGKQRRLKTTVEGDRLEELLGAPDEVWRALWAKRSGFKIVR